MGEGAKAFIDRSFHLITIVVTIVGIAAGGLVVMRDVLWRELPGPPAGPSETTEHPHQGPERAHDRCHG